MIFDMPEETGGGLISGLPLVSLYGCVALTMAASRTHP